MDGREPDTPGGWRERGVDIAVWCLATAAIVGFAAGAAWLLSSARFEIREVPHPDDRGRDVPIEVPARPAAPDPPSTTGPNGEVVRAPVWVRAPAPDFPELAMMRGVESGAVTLRCEALASGEMGACEVLAERPAGAGFAAAALQGARRARVTPRSVDGFETDSTVQYTVRFRVAPE